MALLLIMGVDKRMPTVEAWRSRLTTVDIPAAHTWLTAHPNLDQGLMDFERWMAYQHALKIGDTADIAAYEGNPVSSEALSYAHSLHRWRPENADPHDRAPLVDLARYHRRILDVEANKTDAEKGAELAAKDQRGCYKRGDIIEVYDDNKHNGDLVANPIAPPCYVIRITGVTKAQVEKYLEPEWDTSDPPQRIRRRRRRLLVDDIPAAIRTALQTDRYVSVTRTQIQNYLVDKRTGIPD